MDTVDNHVPHIDVNDIFLGIHEKFGMGDMPNDLNTEILTIPPFDIFVFVFGYYTGEKIFSKVLVEELPKEKIVTIFGSVGS